MIGTLTLLAAGVAAAGCPAVFDELANATEANYAGHVLKLPDEASRTDYRRFRTMLADRASRAEGHAACRTVLQAYVGFYADHHLFVRSREHFNSPIPALREAWNDERAQAYLAGRAGTLDPVEGRWFDATGTIGVVHDAALAPGQFVAVRLDGEAQGIPIALLENVAGHYRIHHEHPQWGWQLVDAGLHRDGSLLSFDTHGWGRPGDAHLASGDPMAPVFKDLGEGIYYLSMPSFMEPYRQPLMDIIATHGTSMGKARAIIADVRGNAGGNALYFPLAPYFLANDIRISEPSSVLASPWTIASFEGMRKNMGEHGAFLDAPLQAMREHPGEIVAYMEASTDGMPEYPPLPAQVVVLQDRGTGSAAEAFVYHARQSAKVVTIGEPTRGNIDYMQVSMHPVGAGEHQFWFGYPLYFKRGLPEGSIDDEGYAPDIRVDLPQSEWLPFALDWIASAER